MRERSWRLRLLLDVSKAKWSIHSGLPSALASDVTVATLGMGSPRSIFKIVVRSSGVTESIGQHGPALGILPSFDYPHFDLQLDSGDAVMLFSQGDAGLMRGAADLLRARQSQPVAETAAVLRSALGRAHDFRKGNDMAFVLARKI